MIQDIAPFAQTPSLVFLHGWGFHPGVYTALASVQPSYALRLPGHAGDGTIQAWATPDSLAGFLQAQLPPSLQAPVWVGWSLGGLAALALAWHWTGPQRLVLLQSSPCWLRSETWSGGLDAPQLDGFASLLTQNRGVLERRFAGLCAQGSTQVVALRRRVLAELQGPQAASLEGLHAALQALQTWDLRSAWVDLKAPVSALLAREDALLPTTLGTDLQTLRPDAAIHWLDGGHAQWWLEPEPVSRLLAILRLGNRSDPSLKAPIIGVPRRC